MESTQVTSGSGVRTAPTLTIIVPCFNEEEALPATCAQLVETLERLVNAGKITPDSKAWLIDDGSKDATWRSIEQLAAKDRRFCGVKLSRNQGHQNALLAGLLTAPGDVLISVDADLQDDLHAIDEMIDAYRGGAEVVYGIRRRRDADSFFKRFTAEQYYRMLRAMGVNIIFNHADFRLLSRRVIDVLREYKEANLFLRGIVPQLGFNTAQVYYDRSARTAGVSKYPLRKMTQFALEGITSFSAAPLKFITVLGITISFFSFGTGLWALWVRLTNPLAVPGWASTVIPMYLLGGIQLLSIGVIGQYLAKIYLETKQRPRFIIEKMLD